ncbi:zinc knuckle (CCHC-type) family protein isoform X2 [Wolffia australiana]
MGFEEFLFFMIGPSRRPDLCNNCKRPGHFARDCPNVGVCNNCSLPGHIAAECTAKAMCWNCKEPGHMASGCPNEGICHTCGKAGHLARACTVRERPPGDLRLCNNCYKQGHLAADCTNDKACNNCRQTGHLARDCHNDPVCNLCNVAGHRARNCPKAAAIASPPAAFRGGAVGPYGGNAFSGFHMAAPPPVVICHNCGGRGHIAYECPSDRFFDRALRRY